MSPTDIPSLIERLQQIEAVNTDTALWSGKWLAVLACECRSEIERLNVIITNHGITQLEKTEIMLKQAERIEELERLTVSPLPEEIEKLAAEMESLAQELDSYDRHKEAKTARKAASALSQQALENDRAKGMLQEAHNKWEQCLERIRKLEADLSAARSSASNSSEAAFAFEAQRDNERAENVSLRIAIDENIAEHAAVRAKTIAEIEDAVSRVPSLDENGYIVHIVKVIEAIRALSQPQKEG